MIGPHSDPTRARPLPTIALSFIVLVALVPVLWLVMTSLKPGEQTATFPPQFVPTTITLDAYKDALGNSAFVQSFANSAIFSVGAALVSIGIALPTAYAVARLPFRGKTSLVVGLAVANMIPGVALLLPLLFMADRTGLVDTYLVVIIVYAAQFLPQAIWFTRTYIEAIPDELEQAALIDGCNRFQAFRLVTFRLITPGLAALFVLGVMFVWNDYIVVATLTRSPEMQSVQVRLVNELFNATGISWATVTAYVTLSMLPIVIFFLWMQRWFVRGIATGAMKG
ncbi:carbohydrate ABC transporter permease [Arthrobacter sp. NPDC056727]|uniref:carbohydrate ABC transporter permease n=1 Tax=Arthrobacter sp. NPDC056727 TaxID=3345927 RepID=UPI00366E2065